MENSEPITVEEERQIIKEKMINDFCSLLVTDVISRIETDDSAKQSPQYNYTTVKKGATGIAKITSGEGITKLWSVYCEFLKLSNMERYELVHLSSYLWRRLATSITDREYSKVILERIDTIITCVDYEMRFIYKCGLADNEMQIVRDFYNECQSALIRMLSPLRGMVNV